MLLLIWSTAMGIEMEVWQEDVVEFNEIMETLGNAYWSFYEKEAAASQLFWDATNYQLYGFVPCYAEGVL
jgi:hypothetical protein